MNIGRTLENDVVLQDAGVSRRHVRISDRLGRFYVQDLGSSNGTLVNDQRLSGEQELRDGDRISLGPVEFLFQEVLGDEDATRPFMPMEEDEDATRPIRRNVPQPLPRADTVGMSAPMSPPASGPPVLYPVSDAAVPAGAEIIPVPDLRPEELLETARGYVSKARGFYERKDVGPENLFLAWENYRSAWITLEALDDKPDLYQDVQFMLGQVAADLDQKCGQLMLDFQRNIQLKDTRRAGLVLDEINRRFPTPAHRCHNLALEKANEYEL